MPLPKKQICKSLKQLSLNFANQNFAMFYERYNKSYGEERIGSFFFSLCIGGSCLRAMQIRDLRYREATTLK